MLLLSPAAGGVADAQSLPGGPSVIGPLRRGDDGRVESVTPETERQSGRPLCDQSALCVGKGERYPTVAAALEAAHAGSTIDVVGDTFHERVSLALPHVTVRGTAGRPHFDCAGLALPGDKACFSITADGVTLDNLEISGATVPVAQGGDGACIRSKDAADLTLASVFCHGSQNGVIVSGGSVTVTHSEFYGNGGKGIARNADFGDGCTKLTVTGSIFRDTRAGDEFTSRCLKTEISDSTFRSTQGRRAVDFPDAGDAMIFRSTFEKTPGSSDRYIITFASDSCAHPGSLTLKEITILNSRSDSEIRNFNRCREGTISLQQVMVQGYGVATVGFFTDFGGNNLGAPMQGAPQELPVRPPSPTGINETHEPRQDEP
ncbi:MAG TPA: right-handed parallel beta-helix repeat-containing protein [Stellaceae bacterium]|nr:right-handed parallel beta-helix repeat-containing protein [Stellaceae bacterium]